MSHGKLKNRPLWPMRHVRPRPIIPFPVWHSASPPGILQQTSSKVRFNTLNHPTLAKFTQRNCSRQHYQLIYVHFDSGVRTRRLRICILHMRNEELNEATKTTMTPIAAIIQWWGHRRRDYISLFQRSSCRRLEPGDMAHSNGLKALQGRNSESLLFTFFGFTIATLSLTPVRLFACQKAGKLLIEWLELPDFSRLLATDYSMLFNFLFVWKLLLAKSHKICQLTSNLPPLFMTSHAVLGSLKIIHGHLTTSKTLRGQISGLDDIGWLQQIPHLADNGAPDNALLARGRLVGVAFNSLFFLSDECLQGYWFRCWIPSYKGDTF